MSKVLDAIACYASADPNRIAIEAIDTSQSLSYRALNEGVNELASVMRQHDISCVALAADNGPAWALIDLACMAANVPVVPVPHFFSAAQIDHLFHAAGINTVLTDNAEMVHGLCGKMKVGHIKPVEIPIHGTSIYLFQLATPSVQLPQSTAKITFTSGSTGDPKGVCLSLASQEQVAASLAEVTGANEDDRHLSLLPYATLLENIGGIYAPLLTGATIIAVPLSAVGLSGASGLDIGRFMQMLVGSRATTCILIPQMLHALVAAIAGSAAKPALRYIAVGGAPVSLKLLEQAQALELPVYEGYGLSEAASVVAVNRADANRPGAVGKLLPHVEIQFDDDGEILVAGSLFSGYLGEAPVEEKFWPTGDIGYLDEDGYLHLSGRKKHIFITAYGRNVSPEWVERELSIEPAIAQCCVFGEAQPYNVAVIVARPPADAAAVEAAVAQANARLPDYAQISRWLSADAPFSIESGLWTGTGRPRRSHIYAQYKGAIEALYEEP